MPSDTSNAVLRSALHDRFAAWLEEVDPLLEESRRRSRTEVAETLNQASRRMRLAGDFDELAATLADAAAAFCDGAAVLSVAEGRARGERIRGVDAEREQRFRALEIPLETAAALAGVVANQDPAVAMGTAAEVSAELLEIAGTAEGARVSVFPLLRGDKVEALLYCWGDVPAAPVELLAQVAGLCLPPEPVPEMAPLVSIAPAPTPPPAPPASAGRDWDQLTPAEQSTHLSAQRFARVRVAEMRLHQAEAVHAGRLHRDIYGSLQDTIDRAREKFRWTYMTSCPSMVDYFHLELVRTLAHENPRLLGESYPGPLV